MAYPYQWLAAGTRMYAGTVNNVREAILRRAEMLDLTPADIGLPIEHLGGDRVELGMWLDQARGSIEAILDEGQYGRFVRDWPGSEALLWTPWNKADLIAKIRTPNSIWPDLWWQGYVAGGVDWRAKGPIERPCVSYINELISACELLTMLPITTPVVGNQISNRVGNGTDPTSWQTSLQNAAGNWNAGAWSAPAAGFGEGSSLEYFTNYNGGLSQWEAVCRAYRGNSFTVTIPALAYPVKEYFMPWSCDQHSPVGIGWPQDTCYVYDAVNFTGNLGRTLGMTTSMFPPTYSYLGWQLFGMGNTLSWNDVARDFSNQFYNIVRSGNGFYDWWAGPNPADQSGSARQHYQTDYIRAYARFEFDGYAMGTSVWFPESLHWPGDVQGWLVGIAY